MVRDLKIISLFLISFVLTALEIILSIRLIKQEREEKRQKEEEKKKGEKKEEEKEEKEKEEEVKEEESPKTETIRKRAKRADCE